MRTSSCIAHRDTEYPGNEHPGVFRAYLSAWDALFPVSASTGPTPGSYRVWIGVNPKPIYIVHIKYLIST